VTDDEFGSSNKAPQGAHGGKEQQGSGHVSVLLKEAISFLNVTRAGTYIDATLGLGGHSSEILRRLGPQGHLIGFDKDPEALAIARTRLEAVLKELGTEAPQLTLIHDSYAEIGKRIPAASVDGLLADLGLSSFQLANPQRGFSFQAEGPLDMRMDPQSERSADQVVNHMREEDLANVIYEFGEERRSRRIARAIVRARPIKSTAHLAQVISAAAPTMKRPTDRKSGARRGPRSTRVGQIHPATRTFQAIRIYVNRELEDLDELLKAAPKVLRKSGRLVVISFHSLEDRQVKDAMREGAQRKIYELLTRKPVTAGEEEIDRNPRARSAKLRAAEKA
jgi:16S rRNA (cytosine1402-N4)-methyltransferase